ncbi:hypothetical protein B0T25DRAFT_570912 [Lasiosphaeria hispida]|uniref:Uncharacterized protein n=1 Tax=Lasiosphaeria hispida TaxID=260671 RepID=A0AAJ0MD70_9PEZI|nr:hypothetical protein B0T25DRAFT_570912 [Lasiosphaeria hispida]
MSEDFNWKEHGLNRARFEALTKLLAVDWDAEADTDSTKALPLTNFESGRLRRLFLDRLAELVANEKGGRHVTATMMSVGWGHVTIVVARNNRFRAGNEKFPGKLETLLQQVAATSDDGSRDELWSVLLAHYESRIRGYIVDVRQLLKRYYQTENTTRKQSDDMIDDAEPSLQSSLAELRDAAFGRHSSATTRSEACVLQAHHIYKNFPSDDFAKLASQEPRSEQQNIVNLHFSIARHAGLEKGDKKTAASNTEAWTLATSFRHLGHALTDDQVQKNFGASEKKARWNKSRLAMEFSKLKSATWEVHAEMQLFCRTSSEPRQDKESVVPYLGCSKHAYFLCWHFLDVFLGFKTRGCHGKLYNLWGLPSAAASMGRVASLVRDLEALVKREILDQDVGVLPLVRESTTGPGPHHHAGFRTTVHVGNHPGVPERPARAFFVSGGWYRGRDPIRRGRPASHRHGTRHRPLRKQIRLQQRHRTSMLPLQRPMVLQHGLRGRRRPINTADLLVDDIFQGLIPSDPQVRKDFGFHRCRNHREESHLFWLYIGLTKYHGISVTQLHSWRATGILTDKIIEQFSALPEGLLHAHQEPHPLR